MCARKSSPSLIATIKSDHCVFFVLWVITTIYDYNLQVFNTHLTDATSDASAPIRRDDAPWTWEYPIRTNDSYSYDDFVAAEYDFGFYCD